MIELLWNLPNSDTREGGLFPKSSKVETKAPPAIDMAKHTPADDSLWNIPARRAK